MLQGNLAANARCGRIFSDDSILQIFVSQWQDFLHCTLQQLINHYRNLTMGLPLGSFIIGKIAWTGQLCCLWAFITKAGGSRAVDRVISGICDFCVCLCVHALKGKWLELSTPNLVDTCCTAVTRHALTWGQMNKVVQLLNVLPAWVCMLIGLLSFLWVLWSDCLLQVVTDLFFILVIVECLQCFDTVGWASERASGL